MSTIFELNWNHVLTNNMNSNNPCENIIIATALHIQFETSWTSFLFPNILFPRWKPSAISVAEIISLVFDINCVETKKLVFEMCWLLKLRFNTSRDIEEMLVECFIQGKIDFESQFHGKLNTKCPHVWNQIESYLTILPQIFLHIHIVTEHGKKEP